MSSQDEYIYVPTSQIITYNHLPIVQKGKFSAAAWLFVKTLKKVDFLQVVKNTITL